jgi:hypothetical protein
MGKRSRRRKKLPGQPVTFVPPPRPGTVFSLGDLSRADFGSAPAGMVDVMPHHGQYPEPDQVAYAAQFRCGQCGGRVIAMTYREDMGLWANHVAHDPACPDSVEHQGPAGHLFAYPLDSPS